MTGGLQGGQGQTRKTENFPTRQVRDRARIQHLSEELTAGAFFEGCSFINALDSSQNDTQEKK